MERFVCPPHLSANSVQLDNGSCENILNQGISPKVKVFQTFRRCCYTGFFATGCRVNTCICWSCIVLSSLFAISIKPDLDNHISKTNKVIVFHYLLNPLVYDWAVKAAILYNMFIVISCVYIYTYIESNRNIYHKIDWLVLIMPGYVFYDLFTCSYTYLYNIWY